MQEVLKKVKNGLVWFFKSFIWIVPLVIIIDQVSKLVIQNIFVNAEITPDLYIFSRDFIVIDLTYNTGAAWSILDDKRWLLAVISVIASIGIIYYLVKKYKTLGLFERICGFIILGGCMGNMIDRIFYEKGVIDFIRPTFINFPTFNIADSALVVGIIALLIKMLFEKEGEEEKKDAEKTDSKQQ